MPSPPLILVVTGFYVFLPSDIASHAGLGSEYHLLLTWCVLCVCMCIWWNTAWYQGPEMHPWQAPPYQQCSGQTKPRTYVQGWIFVCLFVFLEGGICLLFSSFELHHTKTLANQELGHTSWPLASLSQGDLLRKALRLDASD